MSTHLLGFQSFFFKRFLHHFVLTKVATSNIRVKDNNYLPSWKVKSVATAQVLNHVSVFHFFFFGKIVFTLVSQIVIFSTNVRSMPNCTGDYGLKMSILTT